MPVTIKISEETFTPRQQAVLTAALDLLVDTEQGIWHLAPRTTCSVLELARRAAQRLGLAFHAQPAPSLPAVRGPMRALTSERGWPLPDLDGALEAYARHFESRSAWGPTAAASPEPSPGSRELI